MPRISAVGSINMDLVVMSDAMPKKGETVFGKDFRIIPGGKGANQAVAIAKIGGHVDMLGCVGEDSFGELALSNLRANGVFLDHVKPVSDVPTGVALINVSENDNTIIVVAGANNSVDTDYIDSVRDTILGSDIVLLQHEIPFETVEYVIRLCWKSGVPVVLNPAPAMPVSEELIGMVKYITPNEHEINTVMRSDEDHDKLLARYPGKLIMTLGKNGVAYHNGVSKVRVPAIDAKVQDTTGAGDTFCGAFVKAISEGAELEEAIVFGQYASGLSVEKIGAQSGMPTLSEIKKRMEMEGIESSRYIE
jgi:ribokinase